MQKTACKSVNPFGFYREKDKQTDGQGDRIKGARSLIIMMNFIIIKNYYFSQTHTNGVNGIQNKI